MASGSGIIDARRWRTRRRCGSRARPPSRRRPGPALYEGENGEDAVPGERPAGRRAGDRGATQRRRTRKARSARSTVPEGRAIWINGELRKEVTPARFEGLPIGRDLQVKLTKAGLQPYQGAVVLQRGDTCEGALRPDVGGLGDAGSQGRASTSGVPRRRSVEGRPGQDRQGVGGRGAQAHAVAAGYATKTMSFSAQPGETKIIEERLQGRHGHTRLSRPPTGRGASTRRRLRLAITFLRNARNR